MNRRSQLGRHVDVARRELRDLITFLLCIVGVCLLVVVWCVTRLVGLG